MASLKVNRALYVIVFGVIAAALFTFNMSRNKEPQLLVKDSGEFMDRAPTPKTADADTTVDTLSAIKGHVAGVEKKSTVMQTENKKLVEERNQLMQENKRLAERFESRLNQMVEETRKEGDAQMNVVVSKLNELIQSNRLRDPEPESALKAERDQLVGLDALPSGFGGMYERGSVVPGNELLDVIWIEPLDDSLTQGVMGLPLPIEGNTGIDGSNQPTQSKALVPLANSRTALSDLINGGSQRTITTGKRGVPKRRGLFIKRQQQLRQQQRLQSNDQGFQTNAIQSNQLSAGNRINNVVVDDRDVERFFTIPDTSLLANSTALTALVGKVFLDNEITDPRLFKIKVGRDNVTSNGIDLPAEIEGTIMEGFAFGEYSTSCIRGVITAATFVFRDGTVRSMYPGDPGTRRNTTNTRSLGYISDKWGNDCIPGVLISDGNKFIAQSFALAGLAGYAEAFRDAQTNRRTFITDEGTEQTFTTVPGGSDTQRFAEASALAGGIEELVEFIRQRHGIATDLIYLPAGQKVDVHIQQELRLDIPANARKVRHKQRGSSHVKNTLD